MFIFFINCFIARNDVLLRKLKLKRVGIIEFYALYNKIIKQPRDVFFGRILESFCLPKAALTLN